MESGSLLLTMKIGGEKKNGLIKGILIKKSGSPLHTKESGIGEEAFHPNIWYRRSFEVPEEFKSKYVILHFNASDYITKVWVDGVFVGRHQGGYSRFSFDLTENLSDSDRHEIHLQSVKITPDIDTESVTFNYQIAGANSKEGLHLQTDLNFEGKPIKSFSEKVDRAKPELKVNISSTVDEWGVKLWHPNHPNLYDLTFTLYDGHSVVDQVHSYFGMRKVSIENGKVLLNNSPIYQKLILNQGYWPDTHLTTPSEEALIEDIERTLEMGFNGVRKHQKIEDPRYLYWCDRKGLLVWSEVAATYEFSDEAIDNFTKEWIDIVSQNYNHPSIITWTPFNESWGVKNILVDERQQKFTESIYYLTKSIDSMRPVIVNDGWEHTISDIISLHDYEEVGAVFSERYVDKEKIVTNKIPHNRSNYAMAKGYTYKGQPILLTEYGGIAFDEGKGWGYGNQVTTEEAFFERYQSITQAIKDCSYISGYCYTQITDVQQEINGLLTADRKPKVDLKKVREINQ
jgi:beta-galactosidase/beta-glucuronidase